MPAAHGPIYKGMPAAHKPYKYEGMPAAHDPYLVK